ncbi:MAG: hypothetical protein IPH33_14675 [Bacteroidetes bacterium]|nr:hypothetical protein [Bacteroidota bacterium]
MTDSNGSSSTTSIVITEPAELIATATATPILCNGDLSTVAITANGGTAPYNGIGSFSVGAGTYSYVISDANGCSDTVSVIITEPNTLIASATATPIFCIGGTSTITVSASGGIAPYTGTGSYSVVAGTYSYTVVDANGCSVSTAPVTISAPAYGSYTSASINLGGT